MAGEGRCVSFRSTGYSVLPRDEERLADLRRRKKETLEREEAQKRRRAEMAAQQGADEDRADGAP